ncbi:MAG: porin family protein [Cyclobacteriaceae bacterium]
MKRILLLAFLSVTIHYTWAQNCSQTLRLARSTYDQGRLHELPKLMEKCLANTGADGFTKQERVEAYKLLTMAFIYLEEPEKADSSMLLLLHTDPYFKLNENVDPAEFIGLYKTFRTRPVFRLGVKFGVNATQPNVSSFNPITDGSAKYDSKIGIGGGFIGELPINDKLTLSAELLFQQKSFTNTTISTYTTSSGPVDFSTSTGTESQSWLSLPILAQYQLIYKKRLEPFVVGGVSADFLLNSTTQGERRRVENQSIDVKSFSLSAQREKLNISVVLGAGVKTRIATGYLIADVRYSYGLTKVNSLSTLYDNQYLLFDYGLMDGIFNLNSLYFNVGYVQNFFNPKKLKRKK